MYCKTGASAMIDCSNIGRDMGVRLRAREGVGIRILRRGDDQVLLVFEARVGVGDGHQFRRDIDEVPVDSRRAADVVAGQADLLEVGHEAELRFADDVEGLAPDQVAQAARRTDEVRRRV